MMPLTLFLVLGSIQLFMMFQGRAMAQYAAARATRAGSVKHGACDPMLHSALAALLPVFTPTRTPLELADAFFARKSGRYAAHLDDGHDESIVWVIREGPRVRRDEEEEFDLASERPQTLAVRLVFWFPLRIPFANQVVNAMALAHFGLRNLSGVNPLLVTQGHVEWEEDAQLDGAIAHELLQRANRRHYVMPIQVTYSMRMMTPARRANLEPKACPPYP